MNRREVLKLSVSSALVLALPLPCVPIQESAPPDYDAFMRGLMMGVARAMAIPYEQLTSEYHSSYLSSMQGPLIGRDVSNDLFDQMRGKVHAQGRQNRPISRV